LETHNDPHHTRLASFDDLTTLFQKQRTEEAPKQAVVLAMGVRRTLTAASRAAGVQGLTRRAASQPTGRACRAPLGVLEENVQPVDATVVSELHPIGCPDYILVLFCTFLSPSENTMERTDVTTQEQVYRPRNPRGQSPVPLCL